MPSGDTIVSSVSEGLDTIITSARLVREFPHDVMVKLVDRQTLTPNTGVDWREFALSQLTAQNTGETDDLTNPQQLDGSILTGTPQLVSIMTFIGDRVADRLNRKAYGTFGEAAQNAIQRKKDQDGLALFATASATVAGTGVVLTSGHIAAGVDRIASNSTEPGPPPYAAVFHRYGLHALRAELTGGIGSYPTMEGPSADAFKQGYRGMIDGCNVYEDGLISVDSTPDARGGVFSKMGVVLIQGMSPWTKNERYERRGYGGNYVIHRDEYVFIERSAGRWLFSALHNATAPTS